MACYVPRLSTIAAICVIIFALWHRALGHVLHVAGIVTEIAVVAGAAAVTAVLAARITSSIKQRRASAGACTDCQRPCQRAMTPAERWPGAPRVVSLPPPVLRPEEARQEPDRRVAA